MKTSNIWFASVIGISGENRRFDGSPHSGASFNMIHNEST